MRVCVCVCAAQVYAVRSMEEIRTKQREDLNRFGGVLGDTLEAGQA
jgi:hypothetical protein